MTYPSRKELSAITGLPTARHYATEARAGAVALALREEAAAWTSYQRKVEQCEHPVILEDYRHFWEEKRWDIVDKVNALRVFIVNEREFSGPGQENHAEKLTWEVLHIYGLTRYLYWLPVTVKT